MNIRSKQIPIFIFALSILFTFIFWYLQPQFLKNLLYFFYFLSSMYLGKTNKDRAILFLPVVVSYTVICLLKVIIK